MKALSQKQIEWIFKRNEEFVVYWSEHLPSQDSDWQELMRQANELHEKARGDEYTKALIIQTINYIDSLSGTNRPSLDML